MSHNGGMSKLLVDIVVKNKYNCGLTQAVPREFITFDRCDDEYRCRYDKCKNSTKPQFDLLISIFTTGMWTNEAGMSIVKRFQRLADNGKF